MRRVGAESASLSSPTYGLGFACALELPAAFALVAAGDAVAGFGAAATLTEYAGGGTGSACCAVSAVRCECADSATASSNATPAPPPIRALRHHEGGGGSAKNGSESASSCSRANSSGSS